MSKTTTIQCDICGEECGPERFTEGIPHYKGYNTGVRISLTGKYNQDLDTCTSCQLKAAKAFTKQCNKDRVV